MSELFGAPRRRSTTASSHRSGAGFRGDVAAAFGLRKDRRRRRRGAVARAADNAVENLEQRALFAATLPAGFQETRLFGGFNEPTDFAVAPSGDIFVTEKAGNVRLYAHGSLHSSPFLTLPVDTYRDRGLDAIVLDPSFATNGFFYLYYSTRDAANPNAAPNASVNRLSRFRVDPNDHDHALAASETILLDNIPSNTGYHIGGLLEFGLDGKIYLGTGDGDEPFDTQTSGVPSYAQNLNSLGGKVLRLNPNGSIPADNPFVNQPGKRGEVYAYGLRNPYSGATHPTTGLLYANDVGQALWEEVNGIQAGKNYGWPGAEGNSSNPAYTNPLHAYAHDASQQYSASVTGGAFYTKSAFPSQYSGDYFFADYIQGWVKTYDPASGQVGSFGTNFNGAIRMEPTADGGLLWHQPCRPRGLQDRLRRRRQSRPQRRGLLHQPQQRQRPAHRQLQRHRLDRPRRRPAQLFLELRRRHGR